MCAREDVNQRHKIIYIVGAKEIHSPSTVIYLRSKHSMRSKRIKKLGTGVAESKYIIRIKDIAVLNKTGHHINRPRTLLSLRTPRGVLNTHLLFALDLCRLRNRRILATKIRSLGIQNYFSRSSQAHLSRCM